MRKKSVLVIQFILMSFLLVSCSGGGGGGELPEIIYNPVENGWVRSYQAGYIDSSGIYAGGSEIMHLVGHEGKLYAANGYWMDSRNSWDEDKTGWAQVLRLDSPEGTWEVDLEMGWGHLRAEALKSVTFTTDETGQALDPPVNLLLASTYSVDREADDLKEADNIYNVFVRDDETGTWEKTRIFSESDFIDGHLKSVRDIHVYQDKVTGIDRIFISLGVLGIFSGVYAPDLQGKIRWDEQSETGPVDMRPLATIEVNGDLLFSGGDKVYRRNDGVSPTYTVVHDSNDLAVPELLPAFGGIRGMTAIPNPNVEGEESILFAWSAYSRSRGCIYRLDPDNQDGYTRVKEICLDDLISEYLDGNPVYFVLPAYNDLLAVVDPSSNETVNLVGFESYIGEGSVPNWEGFYAGALYAIRDLGGNYRINEVDSPMRAGNPNLVATRAYTLSPFVEDNQVPAIYFGGHDGNNISSDNMAWIYRTTLENALR